MAEALTTRDHLLDVAGELFAGRGIDAVSVRAVNAAAGLAPAAVHYHFSSKDGLLVAVLEREGERVRGDIDRRADALLARPEAPDAHDVIRILVDSYVDLLAREPARGARWLNITAQLTAVQSALVNRTFASNIDRFGRVLKRAFPDAPDADLLRMRRIVVLSALTVVGRPDYYLLTAQAPQGGVDGNAVDTLIEFLAGGLTAAMRATDAPGSSRQPTSTP